MLWKIDNYVFIYINFIFMVCYYQKNLLSSSCCTSVTNNLLKYKRFKFPDFEHSGFKDPNSFKGDQISCKLFDYVFETNNML